jgi:3-oxoacyl-[acyl-carrier protein] reductase
MIELDFTGKTVLIVGGSSGIGNGIARAFLNCGATVHIWGTRASAADYAGEEGSDCEGLNYRQVDVTVHEAVRCSVGSFGRLDVMVLSQGFVLYKRQEFTPEGWSRVMAVNLDSLLYCATAAHDLLAKVKGSLIIISSTSATAVSIANPAYSASKAAAINLTRSLAKAWAADGVRVNGIAPGYVDTKLTAVTTKNPERLAAAIGQTPAGRLGLPKDIAGPVLFLASPLADYVIGQTLIVDGGITL